MVDDGSEWKKGGELTSGTRVDGIIVMFVQRVIWIGR